MSSTQVQLFPLYKGDPIIFEKSFFLHIVTNHPNILYYHPLLPLGWQAGTVEQTGRSKQGILCDADPQ